MTVGQARPPTTSPRVAYVMSRFPKLTETFILYEILALGEQGMQVAIFPLLRERPRLIQPEAAPLVSEAHYLPFLSWAVVRSHLHFLRHRPRAYLGALSAMVHCTWGSLNFFIGGIGIFPKVVHAARLMQAGGVTHVHCHFASHPALAGLIIHRLVGIPYSFTAHGSDLHVDRHGLCRKVAAAAFVVPISQYNANLIADECGEASRPKLTVIHCGVDTDRFSPVERALEGRTPEILCIGTLHEVKGQTYLIDACRQLLASGTDVTCRLVGDGPDRPKLERQVVEAGLTGRVRFEGLLTRDQIAELMRTADVLVTPSVPTSRGKREGIPVVLMEAMASGIPVVASRISGIPELVVHERNGLLVPPRDAGSMAEAIRRLLHDPILRALYGAAARETVQRDFDVRRNAAELGRRFAMSGQ